MRFSQCKENPTRTSSHSPLSFRLVEFQSSFSLSCKSQWLLFLPSALHLEALNFPHKMYYIFHMSLRINNDYFPK
jgi:hypothetical protein